ncbi:YceD family protein [Catenuloplanes sp. NPDC051500]|uniref:YceD family protein n=1 Tax=Catenuloplanes sp. NPDC051500 TaxID=3363959 RepID=UPI0037B355D0
MPKKPASHLNPRSPLVLDTRELPRRPGAMREVVRVTEAPADLGVEMIGVAQGAEISLDLRLQSVSEGVLVTGTVSGPVSGECGRCLRPISDSLTVTVQELFAYENSVLDETTDEDEFGRVQDDLIDLEPAVRDAVVLALPTNPLCREDCPGLCSECGVHWDDLPADHSHELADPRWAALHNLTKPEE